MSRVVWNYKLKITGKIQTISMPEGCVIIKVGVGGNTPEGLASIWVYVPDSNTPEVEERYFRVYGTGHEIDPEFNEYRGSWNQGPFVWHLFEKEL